MCLHMGGDGSDYCKVAVAVEVMKEMGVVGVTNGGRLYAPETDRKVDLNDSALMQRIRSYL